MKKEPRIFWIVGLVLLLGCCVNSQAGAGTTAIPSPTASSPAMPAGMTLVQPSPAGSVTAMPSLTTTSSAPPVRTPGVFSLLAVGDVMLGRKIEWWRMQKGQDYPFGRVKDLVRSADVAFANLESPLCDTGSPVSPTKEVLLKAPPDAASWIRDAGFHILSLANNHSLDYGDPCLSQTLEALAAQGLKTIGTYTGPGVWRQSPLLTEVNGVRVAWLAYSSVSPASFGGQGRKTKVSSSYLPEVIQAIREAKAKNDVVIVSMHWGKEYQDTPTEDQIRKGHAAIEAGASLILGQHPHVVQGVEKYKNGVIFYSLGNFVFDLKRKPAMESMAVKLELSRRGVEHFDLLPMVLEEGAPRALEGPEKEAYLERVAKLSDAIHKPSEGKSRAAAVKTP